MGAGASVNSPRGGSGALERLPEAQDVPGLVASYMQSCVERHHLRLSAPSSSGSSSSSMDRSSSNSALSPPTLGSGKRSLTPLQSLKSLKSMALKSYSRQENTYIPHEAILSASQTHLSRLRSHNALSARPLATVGSSTGSLLSAGSGSGGGGGPGTGGGSQPGSKPGSFRKTPPGSQAALGTAGDASFSPTPGVPSVGAAAGTSGSKKGSVGMGTGGGGGGGGMQAARPNLRININVNIQDDVDWIHVSDDEGEEEQAPKTPRKALSIHPSAAQQQQSYLLTQSGTIFVEGFAAGIGKDGIHHRPMGGAADGPAPPSSSPLLLHDRVVIMARLGAGASGVVYKALDLWELRLCALKMIPMFDRAKRRQCVKEVSILHSILRSKLDADPSPPALAPTDNANSTSIANNNTSSSKRPHEYIVSFHDAFSNIDEGGVAIMMEYMDGGSLEDIVQDGGCDDETTLASIAQQGLAGLAFLHDCAQLHRDLKPGNFLISKRGDCKIADLGILRQLEPEAMALPTVALSPSGLSRSPGLRNVEVAAEGSVGSAQDSGMGSAAGSEGGSRAVSEASGSSGLEPGMPRAQTFVGTATYMSPERIDGRPYSYAADIWSLGLSLLTVALGKLPIDTQGGYWTILHSIRDDRPPQVPDDGRFSAGFRDFVACMLVRSPADRLTALQLLEHPFLRGVGNENGGGNGNGNGGEDGNVGNVEEEEEEAAIAEAAAAAARAESEADIAVGRRELRAIVSALWQHLEKRRAEQTKSVPQSSASSNNNSSSNIKEDEEEPALAAVLTNLGRYSQADALEHIFFPPASSSPPSSPASPAVRPLLSSLRLSSLSQQLSLPLPLLLSDLRTLIAEGREAEARGGGEGHRGIAVPSQQDFVSTPKAAHGGGWGHRR